MDCGGAFECATGFFSASGGDFFTGLRTSTAGRTLLPAGTSTGRASGSETATLMDRTLGGPDIANPALKKPSSRTHSQVNAEFEIQILNLLKQNKKASSFSMSNGLGF